MARGKVRENPVLNSAVLICVRRGDQGRSIESSEMANVRGGLILHRDRTGDHRDDCQAALSNADQVLHDLYDKVDLPPVRPAVTRAEGLEPGTPFSVNILALAIYLRFTHAISY